MPSLVRPEPSFDEPGRPFIDDEDARAEAIVLAAHARRVYALAEQAALEADQARAHRDTLDQEARTAWIAYDAVSQRHEQARARGTAQRQQPEMTIPDDEARQAVSHAAFTAYQRGDLSTAEFQSIWQKVGGHDPVQDQTDREIETLAAETRRAHHTYKRVAVALHTATEQVRVAEVAERARLDEATQAAREAQMAMQRLAPEPRRPKRR